MAKIIAFLIKNKKYIVSLTAGIGLLVSASQVYDWIYNKGVNDTIVKINAEQLVIDEKNRLEIQRKISASLQLQKDFYEDRIASLKKEKEVEIQVKEVVKYVNKEVVVPADCVDFSNDVVRVLKQANDIVIRAAESRSTESKDNG